MENKKPAHKKTKRRLNYARIVPLVLGVAILTVLVICIVTLVRWNQGQKFIINEDVNVDTETEDFILFMDPSKLEGNHYDGNFDILILGNDTVAYDKGGTNIAELIADKTGATVYNGAFPGTYLACQTDSYDKMLDNPIDSFSFFWLTDSIQTNNWDIQQNALNNLPSEYDKEEFRETLNLLESIDYQSIDLLLIYYDGHDYLAQHPINNPTNMFDISTMEGCFTGSYERYPINYPYMQHMLIAPTFCYVPNDDGTKQGCDVANLGHGNLPTCLTTLQIQAQNYSVSYIDNFYGININAETAEEYLLEDGITPNEDARIMIADRISEQINLRLSK